MKSRLMGIALLSALSAPAFAEGGMYFGLDVGTTSLSNADGSFYGTPYTHPNPGNTRFSLGSQLSDQFALEIGYTVFGDSTVNFAGGDKVAISLSSFQFVGVGSIPVNDRISAYGKLGLARNKIEGKVVVTGTTYTGSESKSDLLYGVGLQYKINERMSVRGEYTNYGDFTSSGGGASSFSIGMTYGF